METAVVNIIIIMGIVSGLTSGVGILPDVLTAAVGGTVTFITSVSPPVTPPLSVAWDFVNTSNIKIDVITSKANYTAPQYVNRITFFMSTGSLELRNLTLNDSGQYNVSINPDGRWMKGQTKLNVLVPVSSVTVTVRGTDLVEFNSSVSLSCSSSGSSLSFLWLNGSSGVTATDRVHLTDGGRNLTIVNVSRYDQGPFSCRVSNAVSNETSEPVKLSISYGPENINLKTSPALEFYVTGSNVNLSCSAVSSPAAQFTWFLKGTQLPDTGPELRLTNIQTSQSGDYSCQAFNTKTLRYQISQPSAVIVLESQPSTGGCSGGCIAGIVIAVFVIVAVVLLVYFLSIKPRDAAAVTGGEGQDNATSPQNQELEYAHISFQNPDSGTVQMGPEDKQTQYAEIKAHKPCGPSSPPTYEATCTK